jgi:hypothetical protein
LKTLRGARAYVDNIMASYTDKFVEWHFKLQKEDEYPWQIFTPELPKKTKSHKLLVLLHSGSKEQAGTTEYKRLC